MSAPLPPGRNGWPLAGESLGFLKDPFGFVRSRAARHGPIFRSHLLGRPTVLVSGPDACEAWLDPTKVERAGSFPGPVLQLFGGTSVALMDGTSHRARKEQVMAAFSPEALAGYLPLVVEATESCLADLTSSGEAPALPRLKRLALACIAGNMLGIGPSARFDALFEDYRSVLAGFTALPVPLPGTAFRRALAARDRIFALYSHEVEAHTKAPARDGLGRMLASGLPAADAPAELHHIVLAGFIVFAELGAVIARLAERADVRDRVAAEVRAAAADGPIEAGSFARMPFLGQVVMEVKRTCPAVPVSFGRARIDFELGGFRIQAGWQILMCVDGNNRIGASFADPDLFDPDRFSDARAEHRAHPHAFVPQGPGPAESHRCAGLDYATLIMATFTVLLVRGYRFELPAQDLGPLPSSIPAEPRSGLIVRLARP